MNYDTHCVRVRYWPTSDCQAEVELLATRRFSATQIILSAR